MTMIVSNTVEQQNDDEQEGGIETDESLLAHLPYPPVRLRHPERFSESFAFSFLMLPSINEKYGKGRYNSMFVRPEYAEKEQREARRIALQRERVGWTCAPTDFYLIYYGFSFSSLTQDNHNPLKSSCDIFGKGLWKSQGRNKPKRWIPYGDVIWNDNRVFDERLYRSIDRTASTHWAYVTIYKYHKSDFTRFPSTRIMAELEEDYSARFPRR